MSSEEVASEEDVESAPLEERAREKARGLDEPSESGEESWRGDSGCVTTGDSNWIIVFE